MEARCAFSLALTKQECEICCRDKKLGRFKSDGLIGVYWVGVSPHESSQMLFC